VNTKKSERQQERTITALLTSDTLDKAARKAGISKRTLQRWMSDGEFQKVYRAAKRELLRAAIGVLTRNAGRAAVVLGQIFEKKKPPENQASRVTAASQTLKLAFSGYELEDFDERLRKLEGQGQDVI
jgi:hypothetical protein